MKVRQNDTLLALRRVQQFLDANTAALATVNTTGARADLDAAVTQLTALAVSQKQNAVQSQGETTKQHLVRTTLLQTFMAPIAAIAKAKLATVPEFSSLKLPKPGTTSQRLLTAAAAMGNAAAPYASTFVAQGLPADFVAELAAAATALQTSIDGRSALKTDGVGATAGVAAEVSNAVAVIKVLNTMVVPLLTGNATLMATWKNAKKITTKAVSTSTPTPPAPTPTPSPTTTPEVKAA